MPYMTYLVKTASVHFQVKSRIASNLNSGSSGPTSREKNIKKSEATGRHKSNAKSKEYKKVIFKLRGALKKEKQTVLLAVLPQK